MTTTDDKNLTPIEQATARRLAELNAMTKYIAPRPARRDIVRSHRVPKRKAIR
jgi:hypothetical protein